MKGSTSQKNKSPASRGARPQFSIVIPSWNRCDNLSKVLNNLLCQKKASFELIVVDNGSRDGTRAVCQALAEKDQRFMYIHLAENKGVPYAVNQGILASRGAIIFCMDDDQISADEYLLEKVTLLAEEKSWDILSIGLRNMADGSLAADQLFPYHKKSGSQQGFYVHNFTNGTIFIKREVIDKIGLFEASYFRQAQENEYGLRAILAGFKVLHYPQLSLQHLLDPFRPGPSEVSYYSLRNTMLMNYQYFKQWRLLVMNGWQVVHYLGKTLGGDLKMALFLKAIRDYFGQRKTVVRHLDYDENNMQRYFFVARKSACTPEAIGRMSFFHYLVSGVRRFF